MESNIRVGHSGIGSSGGKHNIITNEYLKAEAAPLLNLFRWSFKFSPPRGPSPFTQEVDP